MPHKSLHAAGIRIDPPTSVPAKKHCLELSFTKLVQHGCCVLAYVPMPKMEPRIAIRAPSPPELPPAVSSLLAGLKVRPKTLL